MGILNGFVDDDFHIRHETHQGRVRMKPLSSDKTQKPSERINELVDRGLKMKPEQMLRDHYIAAIVMYLDEQAEKSQ